MGDSGVYHGKTIARLSTKHHFKYLRIIKGLGLHTSPFFNKRYGKSAVKCLSPSMHLTLAIKRIYKIHYDGKDRLRYMVSYHDHDYFITGDKRYHGNSYWQPSDLVHRSGRIRVEHACYEYSSKSYQKSAHVRTLRPGMTLSIKKIIFMGSKHHGLTRFELTNGDYVTSNRNYVKWL
ncbi:hypothetical protein HGK75_04545 [uncultured bacterium]|nr:hypothetical protein HGK75_04545 [uncultured bacterium]